MNIEVETILLNNIFKKLNIQCAFGCPPDMVTFDEPDDFGYRDYTINCRRPECSVAKLQDEYLQLLKSATLKDALNWVDHPIMGEVADYFTRGVVPISTTDDDVNIDALPETNLEEIVKII